MNILRAEAYLKGVAPGSTTLADIYDDDDMLQAALITLFPGFEYPDYSHLSIDELRKRYFARPRPLT
jgi:hypothetical protein